MAFGPRHSFGLFDYQHKSPELTKCTPSPQQLLATEGPLSSIKSLKKSLHQSYSSTHTSQVLGKKQAANANGQVQEAVTQLLQACPQVQRGFAPAPLTSPCQVSLRCLYFADMTLQMWATRHPQRAPMGSTVRLAQEVRETSSSPALRGLGRAGEGGVAEAPAGSPSQKCACATACCGSPRTSRGTWPRHLTSRAATEHSKHLTQQFSAFLMPRPLIQVLMLW